MEKVFIVRQKMIEYYAINAESEKEALEKFYTGECEPFEYEYKGYTIEEENPY